MNVLLKVSVYFSQEDQNLGHPKQISLWLVTKLKLRMFSDPRPVFMAQR